MPKTDAPPAEAETTTAETTTAEVAPAPGPVDQKPPLFQAQAALTDAQLSGLARIAANRYGLYFFPGKGKGFALADGGSYLSNDDAQLLFQRGLTRFEPSGGKDGSMKITDAGREFLKAKVS